MSDENGNVIPNLPDTTGGGVMDFIKSLGVGAQGFDTSRIPALLTAYNQYNNSGKYMDLATKYSDQMNPFGKERPFYQDRLRSLETNPNAYLDQSPDYQAALRQGVGARERSNAASGYAGSGTGAVDVQRTGADIAANYLDRDRQSLMKMAGADIGPGAAGHLIETGITGSIKSQDDALASLMWGLSNPEKNTINNYNNGGPGGGGGGPLSTAQKIFQGMKQDGLNYEGMIKALTGQGMSLPQAQQFIRDGQAGGDLQTGDGGNGPAQGLDGWYKDENGNWTKDPISGGYDGGYQPGEPGYDTGGSTPITDPMNPYGGWDSDSDTSWGGNNDFTWDF